MKFWQIAVIAAVWLAMGATSVYWMPRILAAPMGSDWQGVFLYLWLVGFVLASAGVWFAVCRLGDRERPDRRQPPCE